VTAKSDDSRQKQWELEKQGVKEANKMKRRILGISMAVLVILSLCLSTAASVMASEADDEPVASVSWSGRISIPDDQLDSDTLFTFSVKKSADGTLDGRITERRFSTGEVFYLPVLDAHFYAGADGAKIADILTSVTGTIGGQPLTFYFWAQLTDRGEPGQGTDTFARYVYTAHVSPSWPYAAVTWPPSTPPPYWWPLLNMVSVFPPNPYFSTPPTIASGNIQIHLPD
jgi:hypothetical protein